MRLDFFLSIKEYFTITVLSYKWFDRGEMVGVKPTTKFCKIFKILSRPSLLTLQQFLKTCNYKQLLCNNLNDVNCSVTDDSKRKMQMLNGHLQFPWITHFMIVECKFCHMVLSLGPKIKKPLKSN